MDEQSTDSPPIESNTSSILEASELERDMHKLMTTQVKLAVVQIVLAILGLITGFIIASLG